MAETKNLYKERFEYIIGFLALAISLGSFKEELKDVKISISFITFNLAEYFFYLILGAILALHFYFLTQFTTGQGRFITRLKKWCLIGCYSILLLIVISPFLILLLYGINKIKIPSIPFSATVQHIMSVTTTLVTVLIAINDAVSKAVEARLERKAFVRSRLNRTDFAKMLPQLMKQERIRYKEIRARAKRIKRIRRNRINK